MPGVPAVWALVAVSLPHVWYLSVVNCPSAVTRLCKAIGPDPVDVFASVALALNAVQLSAVASWLTRESVQVGLLERLLSWYSACAFPALLLGTVLKIAIFRAIGKAGVYYGACFGQDIPWCSGFPFNISAHPQYLGSALVVAACASVLCRQDRPGELFLAVWWVVLYGITAIAEEGLIPAGNPSKPLSNAESPFDDYTTKPVEGAELVRELLMVPVALLRFSMYLTLLLLYFAYVLLFGSFKLEPVTKIFGHLLLNSIGMRVRVKGLEHMRAAASNAPYIVVCNHVSYMDPIALAAALGPYAAVARSDMHRFFLIGRIAWLWGMVPVEYAEPGHGRAEQVKQHAIEPERGRSKPPVLIFSEGTTTNGRCLLSFRRGAFLAKCPVLPVTISYRTASGFCMGWVGHHSIIRHLPRMLTEWGKEVHITVHPLYMLDAKEKEEPALAASNVAQTMADKLHVPVRNESTSEAHAYYAKLGIEPYASKERAQKQAQGERQAQ